MKKKSLKAMIPNQAMKAVKVTLRMEAKMMKEARINQKMKAKATAHRSKVRVSQNWIKADHLWIRALEAIDH